MFFTDDMQESKDLSKSRKLKNNSSPSPIARSAGQGLKCNGHLREVKKSGSMPWNRSFPFHIHSLLSSAWVLIWHLTNARTAIVKKNTVSWLVDDSKWGPPHARAAVNQLPFSQDRQMHRFSFSLTYIYIESTSTLTCECATPNVKVHKHMEIKSPYWSLKFLSSTWVHQDKICVLSWWLFFLLKLYA